MIVKTARGLTQAQGRSAVTSHGATVRKSVPALNLQVIEVPAATADAVIAAMKKDPSIARVETNRTRKTQALPSDTLVASQWALPKVAWDQAYGTVTPANWTRVAILDTGVDATHPDLTSVMVPGTSILDGSDGTTDPVGHGTWLAGIVAARTNNEQGIAGVGFDFVQIMPVTVIDSTGLGQDSDIISGLIWAADNGASVILMAFSNSGYSESLQEAIDYAWSKNIVLVAAVGNYGTGTATFPAGDRGVIGVSATDENDALAPFSAYGPSVFLAAPGTNLFGTYLNGDYAAISGTSGSAAMVAGAAALMRAVDPTLSNGVVVSRLARNADPAGTQEQTGNGRLQIARALTDTNTDFIQPAGAAPVGSGGPFVGPYQIAAGAFSYPANQSATIAAGGSSSFTSLVLTVPQNNGSQTPGWTFGSSGSPAITVVNSSTPSANEIGVTFSATSDSDGANAVGTVNTGSTPSGTNQTITYTFNVFVGSGVAANTYTVNAKASSSIAAGSGFNFAITVTSPVASGTLTVGAQTGTATYGAGGTPTFAIDATRVTNGTFNATYSVSGLPLGVSSSFSPSTFNATGTTAFTDSTLTLTVGSSVAAGSYTFTVTATPSNAGPVAFSNTGTLLVGKATANFSFNGATANYDGNGHPASGTASGVESPTPANLSSLLHLTYSTDGGSTFNSAAPVTVGTYAVYYTFDGNTSYNSVSTPTNTTKTVVISKATPTATLQITNSPQTYDGTAKSANVTVQTSSVSGTVQNVKTGGSATQTNPNTYAVVADFVPNDSTNYASLTNIAVGNFVISQAAAVFSFNGTTANYDGNGHPASGTASGVESPTPANLNSLLHLWYSTDGGLNFISTAPVTPGTYAVYYTFDGNATYAAVSTKTDTTKTVVISKVNAVFNFTAATVNYDGNAHAASGTASGVESPAPANLNSLLHLWYSTDGGANFTSTAPVLPGTYAIYYTFDGNTTYNSVSTETSAGKSVVINKVNAVFNFTAATVNYDGNAHAASGTAYGVESPTPADLTSLLHLWYSTDGGANFTSTAPVLPGTYAIYYTFDGNTIYNAVSTKTTASKSVVINKVNAVFSFNGATANYDGNGHPASGTASGIETPTPADLSSLLHLWYSTDGGANFTSTSPVNAGTYAVYYTFDGNSIYNAVSTKTSAYRTVVISKVSASFNFNGATANYDGNAHTASGTATGVESPTPADLSSLLHLWYSTDGGLTFISPVNAGTYAVYYTFDGNTNYNAIGTKTNTTKTVVINKVNANFSFSNVTATYDTNGHPGSGSAAGVESSPANLTSLLHLLYSTDNGLTFSTAAPINAATYKVYYTFDANTNYNAVSTNTDTYKTVIISPATPTVTVTGGPFSFNGLSHPATCTVTGVGAVTVTGSCTLTYSRVSPTYGPTTTAPSGSGTYSVAAAFTSSNTNYTNGTGSGSITINVYSENPVLTVNPTSQTYTGNVLYSVTIPVSGLGGEQAAGNASFYICPSGAGSVTAACQNMTPTPVAFIANGTGGLVANSAPIPLVETVSGALASGPHTVLALFGAVGPDYSLSTPSASLTITPKATAPVQGNTLYTGASVFWTTSTSTSTATLFLTATLEDVCKLNPGTACGNITNARITFNTVDGSGNLTPITGATNLPVGLVNTTDPAVGTAAANVQYNLGNANSSVLTIRVTVSGSYYKDPVNNIYNDTQVMVSKPTAANELKVNASLCNSSTPTCTGAPEAGVLAGATGYSTQFYGDITYKTNGTNPQGNIQTTVVSMFKPDGTPDVTPHTYLIKSNAISTFAKTGPGQAQFTAKASIVDQTTGASVDGGALLNILSCTTGVTCPNIGVAGSNGAISIQVNSSKTGAVWFSSGWTGVTTVPRNALTGGVVQSN